MYEESIQIVQENTPIAWDAGLNSWRSSRFRASFKETSQPCLKRPSYPGEQQVTDFHFWCWRWSHVNQVLQLTPNALCAWPSGSRADTVHAVLEDWLHVTIRDQCGLKMSFRCCIKGPWYLCTRMHSVFMSHNFFTTQFKSFPKSDSMTWRFVEIALTGSPWLDVTNHTLGKTAMSCPLGAFSLPLSALAQAPLYKHGNHAWWLTVRGAGLEGFNAASVRTYVQSKTCNKKPQGKICISTCVVCAISTATQRMKLVSEQSKHQVRRCFGQGVQDLKQEKLQVALFAWGSRVFGLPNTSKLINVPQFSLVSAVGLFLEGTSFVSLVQSCRAGTNKIRDRCADLFGMRNPPCCRSWMKPF